MESTDTPVNDVLIIGGGISGLAASLTLARQQHTAIVFDSGVYRNAPSQHMHNVLAWDRVDPKEYRAAARKNILDYYTTIDFQDVEIASIEEGDGGKVFTAKDITGKIWLGRKVILATGVHDIFPDIPGYADCWAKGIYHCFFCKGYEARGCPNAAILGLADNNNAAFALHFARIALRFSKTITIYTHGNPQLVEDIEKSQGEKPVFRVDDRKIARFEKGPGSYDVIIHFEDGSNVSEGFIGHKPPTRPNGPFIQQLGLETLPSYDPVAAPMFYQTSKRGVFTSGDNASPMKIVPQALFSGSAAGAACCVQLQAEDVGQKGML